MSEKSELFDKKKSLSRILAVILRDIAPDMGLKPSLVGFVSINQLLKVLHGDPSFSKEYSSETREKIQKELLEVTLKYRYSSKDLFFLVTRELLMEIVETDRQGRFEIKNDRIRTKSGHRYVILPTGEPQNPPEILFHGTTLDAARKILKTGLKKKDKSFVHTTDTIERARIIGSRNQNSESTTILGISAKKAQEAGIRFWRSGQVSRDKNGDSEIWLSDEIPAHFIETIKNK